MKTQNIDETIRLIKKGTVEVIFESDLVEKIGSGQPLIIKWGADPSAPDIHLGHVVVIRKLKTFQDLGHKIVFLIGDFTGLIGDPTGRSATRKPLTPGRIKENAQTYQEQIFKILDRKKTKVVFNSHWLSKLTLADIIKLTSCYTIARLLERDDFHKRFKAQEPISTHEFLYPFLQAYDSVYLKADIEIGGTDQKFNLLLGREIQRSYGQKPQAVITLPLLEGTDGVAKMSKSLGNYIGINESPKEIFGKIMSISDELMLKYFELLTDENLEEIKKLHPKEAKKKLGRSLVATFYNEKLARVAEDEFENVFKMGEMPENLPEVSIKSGSYSLIKLLVDVQAAASGSEARRLIRQGGVRIDNQVLTDEKLEILLDHEIILNVGKRKFFKIKPCA